MLERVKDTVDATKGEETGARKTRNGNLMLTVKKGETSFEALRKEITQKVPEESAILLSNRKGFHIRNLDEPSTKEEIQDAVASELSVKPDIIEVQALRPAYGYR